MNKKTKYRLEVVAGSCLAFLFVFILTSQNPPQKRSELKKELLSVQQDELTNQTG